ncbi:unnamed protein product [Amaranthus hypochondriacus]
MVDNQLAQLANPSPPPFFSGNAQPNPASQSSNAQHFSKAIHLRSGTAYEGPSMPQEDASEGNNSEVVEKEAHLEIVIEKASEQEKTNVESEQQKKDNSKPSELSKDPERVELEEMCSTRRDDDELMEFLNDDPSSFSDDAKQLKVILDEAEVCDKEDSELE